jgi:hypothetical protein
VGDSQFTKRAAHAGHETSQLRRPVLIGAPQPPRTRLCEMPCYFDGTRG